MRKVQILEPVTGSTEKKYLNNCLKLNQISTYGKYANQLENLCSKVLKTKYNLATVSGSASLFISFRALGIKKDDLVVVPDYTFAATVNSIILNHAKPWLVDIKKENLCLDIDLLNEILEKNLIKKGKFFYHKTQKKRLFGICPVLTYGNFPDLKKLKKISNKYNCKIVIDAACALGNTYKSQSPSKFADICVYSFNGNKTITGGGGGLISTNDKKIYKFCKQFSNNGKTDRYSYSDIGFNFKITNIHASLAFAQLKKFKQILHLKNLIFKEYRRCFEHNSQFIKQKYGDKNNYNWINYIIFKSAKKTKLAIKNLNKKNIFTFYFWKPISLQRIKKYCHLEKNYNNSRFVYERLLPLPSSINLGKKEMKITIREINAIVNEK